MKKIYQHTFKDGRSVTLACDLEAEPMTMAAHPKSLVNEHREEYHKWLDEVVLPDLMDNLTTKQIITIAVAEMMKK